MYEIYIYVIMYTVIYITSNSCCIYKVQILIVGRVTRVYTKKMNILMSVFSKLFFVLYNSNVALFNHERQLIIVKLLKGIGKVSAKFCRCRYRCRFFKQLPMPILADADSFKKCRYLPIPMPINRHITKYHSTTNITEVES